MAVYACRINEAKLCEREREKKYEIEVDQGWGSRTYRGKRQWPSLKDLGSIIFRLASFEAILVVIADTRRVQLASTNLLSFSRDYILPLDIEPRIHREERERERERGRGWKLERAWTRRMKNDSMIPWCRFRKEKRRRRRDGTLGSGTVQQTLC